MSRIIQQRFLIACLFAATTACASGGGGGASFPGGPVGSPCAPEGSGGCTYADGSPVAELCSGGAWTAQQVCPGGTTCTMAASGQAQCTQLAQTGAGNDTGGAIATDGAAGGANDGATGGANDTFVTPPADADAGAAQDTNVTPQPDANIGPPPLAAKGGFQASLGGSQLGVDYSGVAVSALTVHHQNADPSGVGCIATVQLTMAKPDGSCRLDLAFASSNDGLGPRLKSLSFHTRTAILNQGAATKVLPCAGWPAESTEGPVVYEGQAPQGSIGLTSLAQPLAGQAVATLLNQHVQVALDAPVAMIGAGKQFTLTLTSLAIQGTLESIGNPNASCGKPAFALPKWSLADVNPGSAGYQKTYGLEAFKGKKVVVVLVSDWCNSCLAQASSTQKLQDQIDQSGKADTQLVLIADKAKNNLGNLTKRIKNVPLFADTAAVDAWGKMNAPHAGKFKGSAIRNSAYGFAKNGQEIMYFAPSGSGSLNVTAFEQAVQKVIKAAN